ncbi:hypothetical protein LEP1GSC062_0250 [Leptospira alexanderi serovar Manhao 3 str. L 60]|uniref:Uncharacterized protein n=1 Tax=Leptospira alexanderi serovar Manhao 3 str. L 60 TaxID=1049759 RepID=V6HUI3_9LEPT|nr:hypothetical protein LEP1GSC062_0250 [Leptospira alexanderi serovar Manhao 3 str. L 60]
MYWSLTKKSLLKTAGFFIFEIFLKERWKCRFFYELDFSNGK